MRSRTINRTLTIESTFIEIKTSVIIQSWSTILGCLSRTTQVRFLFLIKSSSLSIDFASSWESLFLKSTHPISKVEFECCYRFVDLCREALLIVYRYTKHSQIPKQLHHQGSMIMVNSPTKQIKQHTVYSINLDMQ